MKHLKTFENFNLSSDVDTDEQDYLMNKRASSGIIGNDPMDTEDCQECDIDDENCCNVCNCAPCECDSEGGENWYDKHKRENMLPAPPDEVTLEKKKLNAGLRAFLDKKKGKKVVSKKEDKDSDKKEDKKEVKGGKGLTAAQKKLPEALQKSILAKKK